MNKTRLFVVDDNKCLVDTIKEYFKDNAEITVSLSANDGEEAIRLIESKQDEYDMILMDLILPTKDGLCILEYLAEKNIDKKVIVVTSYNTQDVIRRVSEYRVNYFLLKPYRLEDLEKRIKEVMIGVKYGSHTLDVFHNNLQICITKTLHELGVPSHIKGYQYIREGITLVYKNPEIIGGITKELYPEIAKQVRCCYLEYVRTLPLITVRTQDDKSLDRDFSFGIECCLAIGPGRHFATVLFQYSPYILCSMAH